VITPRSDLSYISISEMIIGPFLNPSKYSSENALVSMKVVFSTVLTSGDSSSNSIAISLDYQANISVTPSDNLIKGGSGSFSFSFSSLVI